MLKINGIELEFDMSDADVYERYMLAAPAMDEIAAKELTKEEVEKEPLKVAALLRDKCTAMKTFMDQVFGEGTGEKVCGKGNSWNKHKDVLIAVINDVEQQAEEAEKKSAAFAKRYGSLKRSVKKPEK